MVDGGRTVEREDGAVVGEEGEGVVALVGDVDVALEPAGEMVDEVVVRGLESRPGRVDEGELDRGDVRREIDRDGVEVRQELDLLADGVEGGEEAGQEGRAVDRNLGLADLGLGRDRGVRRGEDEAERDERGVVERGERRNLLLGDSVDLARDPVGIVVVLGGEAGGAAGDGVRDDRVASGGVLPRERGERLGRVARQQRLEPGGGVRALRRERDRADVLRDRVRRRERIGLDGAEQLADLLGGAERRVGFLRERDDRADGEQRDRGTEQTGLESGFHGGVFRWEEVKREVRPCRCEV